MIIGHMELSSIYEGRFRNFQVSVLDEDELRS